MSQVKVTFTYTPDDPDDSDATGLSSEEFEQLHDKLAMEVGAENITIEKVSG